MMTFIRGVTKPESCASFSVFLVNECKLPSEGKCCIHYTEHVSCSSNTLFQTFWGFLRRYIHLEHEFLSVVFRSTSFKGLPFLETQCNIPANLTVSKRPGTSYRIIIHFAVFNHLYFVFSFMKLVETL